MWKMDGTGSGSCQFVACIDIDIGISCVEASGSITRELAFI